MHNETLADGQTPDGQSWRLSLRAGHDGQAWVFFASWDRGDTATIAGGSPRREPAPDVVLGLQGGGTFGDYAYVIGEVVRQVAEVRVSFDDGSEAAAQICPTGMGSHDVFIAFTSRRNLAVGARALDRVGRVVAEQMEDPQRIALERELRGSLD